MNIKVSVIIPAYNAEKTISQTIDSLQKQTFTNWQAIIINDGSTDETQVIVENLQKQEPRVKLVNQTNQGSNSARNKGITASDVDWLLFLDADDWIYPQHLEKLTSKLISDPSLDVVYCGWAYVTDDGTEVLRHPAHLQGDLFLPFTEYCVSVIHTYLIPKRLIEKLGKFDESLQYCEDWALLQRIARTGARFGVVPEILSAYRMSPDSKSRHGKFLLEGGCEVLVRGHSPDPEINHPVYVNGIDRKQLVANQFDLLYACAGYLIGGGKDARELLKLMPQTKIQLDPYVAANCILTHALVTTALPQTSWLDIWPKFTDNLLKFLIALEAETGTVNFAQQSYYFAENLIWQKCQGSTLQTRWRKIKANLILWRNHQYHINQYNFKKNMKRLLKITLLLLPTGQQFFYWWHKNQVKHTRIVEKDHPSNNPDNYFEQLFTEQPDPWKYTNNYEKLKYDQTLAMLPHQVINTALELACAEGFFTAKLATKVRYLISTDISSTAISRCQAKMADLTNVEFRCLDFVNETIPGTFDLIVCSEVLYFVGNRSNLPPVVDKFVKALNPGGYLLMAHANVTIDDPLGSGFTWNHALGAKFIGETFAKSSQLKFLQELQTPLYRIQLFQKLAKPRVWQLSNKPIKQEFIKELVIDDINPEVLQDIVMSPITQLPIICYEDIRLENESNSPNIITPQILATHLAYLKENGFQSITFGKWASQVINQVAMSKPKIILIFKNNSVNFANYAWPLLQEYGFTCNLGLYADEIGKLLTTDPNTREQIDLIPWKEIRELQGQGLNFVSRGFSRHPEGQNLFNFKRSYKILQEELATPIYTYLYPTGKSNIFWQYLAGISGYEYGITEKSGLCTMNDSLLALPSLNIQHNTNLQEELNHV